MVGVWQEIYIERGQLFAIHEKCPVRMTAIMRQLMREEPLETMYPSEQIQVDKRILGYYRFFAAQAVGVSLASR